MSVTPEIVSEAAANATGATLVALFPGINAGIMIGAFAGAVFSFVVSSEAVFWKRALLLVFAFALGIYGGDVVAGLMTEWLTQRVVEVKPPLGAMVAAALGVTLFGGLLDYVRDPGRVIDFLASFRRSKGGGDGR